jgi:hypothetical protein
VCRQIRGSELLAHGGTGWTEAAAVLRVQDGGW